MACNDSTIRLYCCRTCEVAEAVPFAGSPFNSQALAVNVTVRHRMLWKSQGILGQCRMGSHTWPVRRINDTLVECQIPPLQAILDDQDAASIVLEQHTVLYKKCYANSSEGLIQVPCTYVDESEAFLPFCRARVEDSEVDYSNSSMTTRFCQGTFSSLN